MSLPDPAFADESLRDLAKTHSSAGREADNERLEFLGDTVLDLVVAEALYRDHPELSEGALTEFKSEVVSRKTLAEAARELKLEQGVQVGSGLRGRQLPRSVLANLYEAFLGAIYLDSGLEAARKYVLETLAEPLSRPHFEESPDNPKQEFQQLCQREWGAPPTYRVVERYGRSHARSFRVVAVAAEREYPGAWGRTLKEAERWAAYEALLLLKARDAGPEAGTK